MLKHPRHLFSATLLAASVFALGASAAATETGDRCHDHTGDHKAWEHKPGSHGPVAWHGPGAMHRALHHKLRGLDLTTAQKDQVKAIMTQQKPMREAKMKELHDSFKALREASAGDQYDSARVQEIASQQARVQADLIVMRSETMHQIYSLLTPEQKKRWLTEPRRPQPVEKS